MDKVLIFGAGGFVGSYLSQEFLENGYKVYGSDKIRGIMLPKEVEYMEANLLTPEEVEKLIKGIAPDIIINLAAVSSVGASWGIPQTTISINVIGALNIMEAAKKAENKPDRKSTRLNSSHIH